MVILKKIQETKYFSSLTKDAICKRREKKRKKAVEKKNEKGNESAKGSGFGYSKQSLVCGQLWGKKQRLKDQRPS